MENEKPSRDEIADEVLSVGVPFDLGRPVSSRRPAGGAAAMVVALFASGAAVALAADRAMGALWPPEPIVSVSVAESESASSPDPLIGSETDPDHETPPEASANATESGKSAEEATRAQERRAPVSTLRSPRAARTAPPRVADARTAPAPAPRWDNGGDDTPDAVDASVEDLLDRALGGAPAGPAVTPAEALPETPNRRQVMTTLRALEGDIRQCADGESGVLSTRIVVAGETGRVTSAEVRGELAGTVAGSCATRVLRTARFPRFSRERFEVAFPYAV